MISFSDIYSRAIGLFDDPKITYAYETNKIRFSKLMWTFLLNAISGLTQPTVVALWAADYTSPSGVMQVFIEQTDPATSELQTTFNLDSGFEIIEGSLYEYTADGESVEAYIDSVNRTVTFLEAIDEGAEFSVEQYFPGGFNQDSINVRAGSQASVLVQTEGILAHRVVLCWGENERNYLLDIRNLMSDTDFKVSPNSKILSSKNLWVDSLITEVSSMETKLGWMLRFSKNSNWGSS